MIGILNNTPPEKLKNNNNKIQQIEIEIEEIIFFYIHQFLRSEFCPLIQNEFLS